MLWWLLGDPRLESVVSVVLWDVTINLLSGQVGDVTCRPILDRHLVGPFGGFVG